MIQLSSLRSKNLSKPLPKKSEKAVDLWLVHRGKSQLAVQEQRHTFFLDRFLAEDFKYRFSFLDQSGTPNIV